MLSLRRGVFLAQGQKTSALGAAKNSLAQRLTLNLPPSYNSICSAGLCVRAFPHLRFLRFHRWLVKDREAAQKKGTACV